MTEATSKVSSVGETFARVTGEGRSKTSFFDLAAAPWVKVDMPADGGPEMPVEIRGKVDFHRFFDGMEIQAIDCGSYNILQTRIPPGFLVPRHKHNTDQIVFVMAGSAVQGNKVISVGGGWCTPAGNPYSIQAGPEGLTWLEVRQTPLAELTTEWMERNPDRWVHGSTS